MRVIWLLFALLLGIGAALWLMSPATDTAGTAGLVESTDTSAPHELSAVKTREIEAAPVPAPAPPAVSAPRASADPVRRIDARTLILDERFEVSGNGTEPDPYRVRWELLGSARETIAADGSATEPPRWIRPLDGAWIEISGYVSTPIVTEETRDVLFTMNRWDGCCIGIPPTPFDCLEAKLESPITLIGKHAIRFAIVRGQLRVEPFALGGALLGIYRLEHAVVTTQAQ